MAEVLNQEVKQAEFTKAKYSKRLLAFFADALTMAIVALLFVFIAQNIAARNSSYIAVNEVMDEIQEKSHLFKNQNDEMTILTKLEQYQNPETDEEYATCNAAFDAALKSFYSDEFFFDQTDSTSGLYLYNRQRIPEGKSYTDLFVYDNNVIVESLTASKKDLYKFYSKAITEDAMAYLMNNDDYMNASRIITQVFFFLELLIPITLSVSIFEFVIPAFDKHGRRTLGKRIFKIGVVDFRGLTPSFKRFFGKFIFFLFIEVILSCIALLIPAIVSFSMFTFSKQSQALHDYVCGTYVVDISQNFICFDAEEFEKKHNLGDKFSPTNKELTIR
mgnify:CR=1 FL=1